jgi:hypothetical protein
MVADLLRWAPDVNNRRYLEADFTKQDVERGVGAGDFYLKMIWEDLDSFDEFPSDRQVLAVVPREVPCRKLSTCCVACSRGG